MLSIHNLSVQVGEKKVLDGLTLSIGPGEVHAIMGPNGAGKSSLGHVLVGKNGYVPVAGSVQFLGKDLLAQSSVERALNGLFMALQYPPEISGVNNAYFLRSALNAQRKNRQEEPLDAVEFLALARQKMRQIGMDEQFLTRGLNAGFSGGEKKRNEVLQMMLFEPRLSILDELDSGLDIDALGFIAKGVNSIRNKERSFIVITHYQRLLEHIVPDYVHVLSGGKIIRSGGKELSVELDKTGYLQGQPQ